MDGSLTNPELINIIKHLKSYPSFKELPKLINAREDSVHLYKADNLQDIQDIDDVRNVNNVIEEKKIINNRTILYLPVIVTETVRAVIKIWDKESEHFTTEDERLMKGLIGIASSALVQNYERPDFLNSK